MSLRDGRLSDQTTSGLISGESDLMTRIATIVKMTPTKAVMVPMMIKTLAETVDGKKKLRIPPVHSIRRPNARKYIASLVKMLAETSRRYVRSC